MRGVASSATSGSGSSGAVCGEADVPVPKAALREILADGCCPLHLRLQFSRVLSAGTTFGADSEPTPACAGTGLALDGWCTSLISSFLPLASALEARAVDSGLLLGVMQRPWAEEGGAAAPATEADAFPARRAKGDAAPVRDAVRLRLWLQRTSEIADGLQDEALFETAVRSYVDNATRRRLEGEVAVARESMEEEVRLAKANMLQAIQAISEEVDRRVRDKVSALQEEFDRRSSEQARVLCELVERRVSEQTAAMQAEVDSRTDAMRALMERRAGEQEAAVERFHEEVALVRDALDSKVREQEGAAQRLTLELEDLRRSFAELIQAREAVENQAGIAKQEATHPPTSTRRSRVGAGTPSCGCLAAFARRRSR